jgi:hypothetical protein
MTVPPRFVRDFRRDSDGNPGQIKQSKKRWARREGIGVHPVRGGGPGQLAADDEDFQVGGGFADREELAHGVEVGELALPAGPGDRAGRLVGGDRAGARGQLFT